MNSVLRNEGRRNNACVVSNRVDSFRNWRGREAVPTSLQLHGGDPMVNPGYADLVSRDGNAERRVTTALTYSPSLKIYSNPASPLFSLATLLPYPFFAAQRGLPTLASAIYLSRLKECTNRLRENR